MDIQYQKAKIEALAESRAGEEKYPPEIVTSFFKVLDIIAGVTEEKEMYQFKGLRYELLKGKRRGDASVRLNNQWRLTLVIYKDHQGSFAEIIDIEDYH